MFGFFYYDWTILILIPGMIFALWAQMNVKSTFAKYSSVSNRRGFTGYDAARKILDVNGLKHISIERVRGDLTDHYDPRANVIRLSTAVYDSPSAAAVGVAAHEAGHAVQHAHGYFPIKVRTAIVPATQIMSTLSMPIFLIGLLFTIDSLMLVGIAFFISAIFFQLVTLPVEFNASRRAIAAIGNAGILQDNELKDAKKVLSAAAMTYVAALASSLLSLLRLIILANNRRR